MDGLFRFIFSTPLSRLRREGNEDRGPKDPVSLIRKSLRLLFVGGRQGTYYLMSSLSVLLPCDYYTQVVETRYTI